MSVVRSILGAIGSLWFAAVLLMLLLIAMGCATVFESTKGTEQALATFYRSMWFEGLLYLVAVNVTAAVLARYPFTRKQVGFVVTHAAIVLTLAGALITEQFGVNGQVGISEGQTATYFNILSQDALIIVNGANGSRASVDLDAAVFRKSHPVENPPVPMLWLADLRIDVLRYLPDTAWSRQVLGVDDPSFPSAIEITLSGDDPTWVFGNHRPVTVGPTPVSFRVISDAAELADLLSESAASQPATSRPTTETRIVFARFPGFSHGNAVFADVDLAFSSGMVSVTCRGATFDIPLEQCLDGPVPVGDTDYTVRVLRYLPHAQIGPDNRLTNASDEPVNPAIEVEITGLAAANASRPKPTAPLEIVSGPDGRMYARFEHSGAISEPRELQVGAAVDTPWHGHRLTVLRRVEHAQVEWSLEPRPVVRENAQPGILVRLTAPGHSEEVWVQRHRPESVPIGDTPYQITYSVKQIPLGFGLTLNSFRIGKYPGSERHRSYESQITTKDPAGGPSRDHLISMNQPAKIAGYTLFQSSYDQSPGGPTISYLSVSRDPGKPVVFAGYIVMMIGMLIVIATRVAKRRAPAAAGVQPPVAPADGPENDCPQGAVP